MQFFSNRFVILNEWQADSDKSRSDKLQNWTPGIHIKTQNLSDPPTNMIKSVALRYLLFRFELQWFCIKGHVEEQISPAPNKIE